MQLQELLDNLPGGGMGGDLLCHLLQLLAPYVQKGGGECPAAFSGGTKTTALAAKLTNERGTTEPAEGLKIPGDLPVSRHLHNNKAKRVNHPDEV